MKCPALSATRVNLWLQCGLKYKFTYHSDLQRKDSIFFKLGKAVHSALEFAGSVFKYKPFTTEEIHVITDRFLEEAAKERIEDVELLKDGKEMILNKLSDFSLGRKMLSLEKFFRIESDEGVPLIGAIDKVEEIDDETIAVVDYKTSKFALSAAELRSDIQLSMYDLVTSLMFPQYKKRVLVMDYLKNKPVYSYRTEEDRDEFSKFITQVYKSIRSTHENDLKPNLNKFCANCDFKEFCPAYSAILEESSKNYTSAELLSDNELIEEWDSIKNRKKILEQRERELKMVVADRIRVSGDDLYGDDKMLTVRQFSRVNYDINEVFKYIPPRDIRKVVTIHKKGLETYLANERPDLSKKIKDTATYAFNSPFFVIKDLGGLKDGNQENQEKSSEE
jgi:putative RecB family exonuclease